MAYKDSKNTGSALGVKKFIDWNGTWKSYCFYLFEQDLLSHAINCNSSWGKDQKQPSNRHIASHQKGVPWQGMSYDSIMNSEHAQAFTNHIRNLFDKDKKRAEGYLVYLKNHVHLK